MLSKEYNPEVLQLPSWVTPIFDTVWLLSLQALDVRTKSCIADAPSRPVRTNVSCAANPDGAPPDVSRNASWLVSPPLRVNICRAATHRRPCMHSISNGSFQLHHGRRCRPPWRFAPISLEASASDWGLGTSWGLQFARCARSSQAPPGAGRAHTGACQLLVGRCSATLPLGWGTCPSVDVGRRHCACSTGTLAPGGASAG
jgi:hypothetical protein